MDASSLRAALSDGGELALIDVRERGRFGAAHLLHAVNQPLSRLELTIGQFVPRLATRMVLCDGDDGFAERAAGVLNKAGYSDVSTLSGGVSAWAAAGYELFRGHYLSSNAFGLHIAMTCATPQISAADLKAKLDARDPVLLVDTRGDDEFRAASIPGAVNLALAEVVYRIRDQITDAATPIVVNCGGVTRGMLGAQSLLDAGIANPVMALTEGTTAWEAAGYPLARDCGQTVTSVTEQARAFAQERARALVRRFPVASLTPAQLDEWRAQADERTLFLVDVRSREEYAAGHVADSVWIPGGQLVTCMEDYLATRSPRFCLLDDDGARAALTASWLLRMGCREVAVLAGGIAAQALVAGLPESVSLAVGGAQAARMSAAQLLTCHADKDTLVLDFAGSAAYHNGHIPGAWWLLRSSLPRLAAGLPHAERIVTTSACGRTAALAAADLESLSDVPACVLDGGTRAWQAGGGPLVRGMTRQLDLIDDVYLEFGVRPDDDRTTAQAALQRAMDWRCHLPDQVARDGTLTFPNP